MLFCSGIVTKVFTQPTSLHDNPKNKHEQNKINLFLKLDLLSKRIEE